MYLALRRSSLLWRIFAVNALLSAGAVALLTFTPAHVHARTRLSEALVLIAGLLVLLMTDLFLVRRALRPLRQLVGRMGAVDLSAPLEPAPPQELSREMRVLSSAFEGMLGRLERERRESARGALAAQEEERSRISRELHDEISQSLTAVALRAEHAIDHPSIRERALAEITALARDSLQGVQRIARELRPEALDDLGLPNALAALCARASPEGAPPIRHTIASELPQLRSEVELVIYRVAQEALTNAMRHGRGVDVELSLCSEGPTTVLSVHDRGPGLQATSGGQGLRGMRERAVLIGAELNVHSVPGAGVQVTLAVPVEG